MVEQNIKKEFNCDIEKLWNIITDNNNYAWRSDLSKIEIIDDKAEITFYDPVNSITTGQAGVIYDINDGHLIMGGKVI